MRPLLVYFINSNGRPSGVVRGCVGGWVVRSSSALAGGRPTHPPPSQTAWRGVRKFHNESPHFISNIQLTFAEFVSSGARRVSGVWERLYGWAPYPDIEFTE